MLPRNAGRGWTLYDGTNKPDDSLTCEIIMRSEIDAEEWKSNPLPVDEWDWTTTGESWGVVAFRVVKP